jgi:hypothetical protein
MKAPKPIYTPEEIKKYFGHNRKMNLASRDEVFKAIKAGLK